MASIAPNRIVRSTGDIGEKMKSNEDINYYMIIFILAMFVIGGISVILFGSDMSSIIASCTLLGGLLIVTIVWMIDVIKWLNE